VLRRQRFFLGQEVHGSGRKDIGWFTPAGTEMMDDDWHDDSRRSLGMFLNGQEIPDRDSRGRPITGASLMVLLHAGEGTIDWSLPPGWGDVWQTPIGSASPAEEVGNRVYQAGTVIPMEGRSLLVLRRI